MAFGGRLGQGVRWGRQGWVLKPEVEGRGGRLGVWCLSIHLPLTPFDKLSSPPPWLHFLLEGDWGSALLPPPQGVPPHKAFTVSHVTCHLRRCKKLAFTPTLQVRTWGLPHPSSALTTPPTPHSTRAQGTVLAPSGLGLQPFASSCLFLGGWPGASCQRWGEFVPDQWGKGARGCGEGRPLSSGGSGMASWEAEFSVGA